MIDVLKFTNIRVVADRLMQHPLLQGLQFETIVQHTLDFLGLLGFNELYIMAEVELPIVDYHAQLPSDLVRIEQVRVKDGPYLKHMSSSFSGTLEDPAYKTQGDWIYTNLKTCTLQIAYRGIPVDAEGYPLILDNTYFLKALEAYIKKEVFGIYFDQGRININILQQAQQDYAFRVDQLHNKMALPSISEMQAISNMWNRMHLTTKDFYSGFDTVSNLDRFKYT